MDLVQVLLIIGIAIGVLLVIVSFLGQKTDSMAAAQPQKEFFLEKRLEAMDTTLSEADNVLTELGGMSRDVMKEMDQKYNELLFLYNLIEEKKKEINSEPPDTQEHVTFPFADANPSPKESISVNDRPPLVEKRTSNPKITNLNMNPRFTRIFELEQKGMTVEQIAKELDMGQGEVSLVVSLAKNGQAT